MSDFETGRKKDLDLVICTPGPDVEIKDGAAGAQAFEQLVQKYNVVLNEQEKLILAELPELLRVPVGSVRMALEAKACMTAHIAALPRLHDELNSSHLAIHGASNFAVAAGFVMVNLAKSFLSPGKNEFDLATEEPRINKHRQPDVTNRTIEKINEIPRRSGNESKGFDAIGIVVIELVNDGSPVSVVDDSPAPQATDIFHYEQMIHRIASSYESRFAGHN
ncbi:MAG: hypothetical protein OEQ39_17100 [Gammaproteobacteria bacterium]|nr:hypothetical protein [Gammaproteobacteria bacterium]